MTLRILPCKALIIVIVPIDHYVRACVIQNLPDRFHLGIIAVLCARAEQRLMEVGQSARLGMLLEILLQPLPLRRTRLAAAKVTATARGNLRRNGAFLNLSPEFSDLPDLCVMP